MILRGHFIYFWPKLRPFFWPIIFQFSSIPQTKEKLSLKKSNIHRVLISFKKIAVAMFFEILR